MLVKIYSPTTELFRLKLAALKPQQPNERPKIMDSINLGIGTVILSDGSKVYNVGITNEAGQYTRLDCLNEKHALQMQADIIETIKKNGV